MESSDDRLSEFKFQGPRQWSLHARSCVPSLIRGTLIGVHGYSEHSGRYAHVAEFFARKSLASYWMDLPGHGQSDGRRSNIDDFSDYVNSLEIFVREVKSRGALGPFFLFGHSLGSLTCLRFLETSPEAGVFDRALISSPLLGLSQYPAKWLKVLKVVTSLLPNLGWLTHKELGPEILTHDREMIASRIADPLIKSRVTIHWLREFLKSRELVFRDFEKIRLPIGLFQAGDERVTDRTEAERLFKLLRSEKRIHTYEGMFHEIVNEVGRAQVLNDMWAWIQEGLTRK